jgi:hypothetical protein
MIPVGPPPRDLDRAACKGVDPHLFDAYQHPEVEVALEYCLRCSVRQSCLDWVQPERSHFDGVCGGKVWRNGTLEQPALFN